MNPFKAQFLPIDAQHNMLTQKKDPRFDDKRNTMEKFKAVSREREIDYRQSSEKLKPLKSVDELKEPPEKWIDKSREKLNTQFLTQLMERDQFSYDMLKKIPRPTKNIVDDPCFYGRVEKAKREKQSIEYEKQVKAQKEYINSLKKEFIEMNGSQWYYYEDGDAYVSVWDLGTNPMVCTVHLPMVDGCNKLRLYIGKDADVHGWETLLKQTDRCDLTVEEYHERYCELIDDEDEGEIYVYSNRKYEVIYNEKIHVDMRNRRKFALKKYYNKHGTYDYYYNECDVYVPVDYIDIYMFTPVPTLNPYVNATLKMNYAGVVTFDEGDQKYNPNITLLTVDEYHHKYCSRVEEGKYKLNPQKKV